MSSLFSARHSASPAADFLHRHRTCSYTHFGWGANLQWAFRSYVYRAGNLAVFASQTGRQYGLALESSRSQEECTLAIASYARVPHCPMRTIHPNEEGTGGPRPALSAQQIGRSGLDCRVRGPNRSRTFCTIKMPKRNFDAILSFISTNLTLLARTKIPFSSNTYHVQPPDRPRPMLRSGL